MYDIFLVLGLEQGSAFTSVWNHAGRRRIGCGMKMIVDVLFGSISTGGFEFTSLIERWGYGGLRCRLF